MTGQKQTAGTSNLPALFTELIQERFDFLTDNLKKGEPSSLYEPIYYCMAQKGKRIRPMLMLSACHMFGGKIHDAMDPAYGIELFHNFTLIHDDIMDDAMIRRGQESVYKRYGLQASILSGDTAMLHSSAYIMKAPKEVSTVALNEFIQAGIRICEGQQLDIDFEEREDVQVHEYLKMIGYKTGVLLSCALKIGAIIAKADTSDVEAMEKFGWDIGIAFQLQDDYLDAFGSADKVGKRIGGDIAQNKKTYLLIRAMEKADPRQKAALLECLSMPANSERKIEQVLSLYQELGIKEETKSAMEAYYDEAMKTLARINATNEDGRLLLKMIAEKIISRDH